MLISIITVNYNDCIGLQRTLDSVRRQTFRNYEHIILDAESTDGSIDELHKYEQSLNSVNYTDNRKYINENLRDGKPVIKTKICKDGGPFFGMNNGIEMATGDFCIFMNSGDSFYDEYVLEKFASELRTKDIYTGIACEHLGETLYVWNPARGIDINLQFFLDGALSHQSSFIKTTLLREMPYDTRYRIAADWKFFLEALICKGKTYETLPFFVSHYMDGGISRDAEKAFAEREKILSELFTTKQLSDAKKRNEWKALAEKIDPVSKVGGVIKLIVNILLRLRKLQHC